MATGGAVPMQTMSSPCRSFCTQLAARFLSYWLWTVYCLSLMADEKWLWWRVSPKSLRGRRKTNEAISWRDYILEEVCWPATSCCRPYGRTRCVQIHSRRICRCCALPNDIGAVEVLFASLAMTEPFSAFFRRQERVKNLHCLLARRKCSLFRSCKNAI